MTISPLRRTSLAGAGATVGDPHAKATEDPSEVTVIGKESQVPAGSNLGVGARLEPGTPAD